MNRNKLRNKLKNELKKCKNTLDKGEVWEWLGIFAPPFVKAFVSKAYGGIDFDSNFELHQIKTPLGPMVSVKKK